MQKKCSARWRWWEGSILESGIGTGTRDGRKGADEEVADDDRRRRREDPMMTGAALTSPERQLRRFPRAYRLRDIAADRVEERLRLLAPGRGRHGARGCGPRGGTHRLDELRHRRVFRWHSHHAGVRDRWRFRAFLGTAGRDRSRTDAHRRATRTLDAFRVVCRAPPRTRASARRCRASAAGSPRTRRSGAPMRCTRAPRFTSRLHPSLRRPAGWRTAGSTSGTRATGRRCTRRPSRTRSGRRRPRRGSRPRRPREWRDSTARPCGHPCGMMNVKARWTTERRARRRRRVPRTRPRPCAPPSVYRRDLRAGERTPPGTRRAQQPSATSSSRRTRQESRRHERLRMRRRTRETPRSGARRWRSTRRRRGRRDRSGT